MIVLLNMIALLKWSNFNEDYSVHARLVEIDQYTKSLEIIGVFVPFDVCEFRPCPLGRN